jgi:hypothetical protein
VAGPRRRVSPKLGGVLLGVASLALLAVLILPASWRPGGGAPTLPGEGGAPRQRFAQLVDLVSAAAERGDATSARDLTQEAFRTFETLPSAERDVDARYHLAMMRAVAGDGAGALAQSDTILRMAADHLLAYYVRSVVASLQGDAAGRRQARAEFEARYPAEILKARPEYAEHRQLLESFRREAP